MRISLDVAFDEYGVLRLLNWLARENEFIFREQPDLPGLYESGVRYQRERGEIFSDYLNLLFKGHEDCDALAAARAGELRARGWRALRPGDEGYKRARRLRPRHIDARVCLKTRTPRGVSGMYHCTVEYYVRGLYCEDDPSERLGMSDIPRPAPQVNR